MPRARKVMLHFRDALLWPIGCPLKGNVEFDAAGLAYIGINELKWKVEKREGIRCFGEWAADWR